MTHSGDTVPRQRESRFQTDICGSHIMADPAELQAQRFLPFTDIFRHKFIRTNIHTTEGTRTGQLGSSGAKREPQHKSWVGVPPTPIRNCLTINRAALSHSTYAQFARTHGRTDAIVTTFY